MTEKILVAVTDGQRKIVLLQDAVHSLMWSIQRSDEWDKALYTPHGEFVGIFLDVDISMKVISMDAALDIEGNEL